MKDKKKLTLMFVPHNGKNIYSIELNFYFLCTIALGLILLIGSAVFVYFKGFNSLLNYNSSIQAYEEQNRDIELFSEEVKKTNALNNQFIAELDKTTRLINTSVVDDKDRGLVPGDLAEALTLTSREESGFDEALPFILLQQKISSSLPVLKKVNDVLESQRKFLKEIPIFLPVKNAKVSMEWGPNIHPVYGYWYLHKGIDLAALPGTPIYAVADGAVTFIGSDGSYGNNVYISHKYGFKTHYSHMKNIWVYKGQSVTQGQVIGTVGSTGVATGPHLDFQIYLGDEIIDPGQYIRYIKNYERPKGNR